MDIIGKNIAGNELLATGKEQFQVTEPATGALLPGLFTLLTEAEAMQVVAKAAAAFKIYK
jgi:acyl-CoA reductase-like NAD-dependent aldehyde dehydrogenase